MSEYLCNEGYATACKENKNERTHKYKYSSSSIPTCRNFRYLRIQHLLKLRPCFMSDIHLSTASLVSPEQLVLPFQDILYQQDLFPLCPVHTSELLHWVRLIVRLHCCNCDVLYTLRMLCFKLSIRLTNTRFSFLMMIFFPLVIP